MKGKWIVAALILALAHAGSHAAERTLRLTLQQSVTDPVAQSAVKFKAAVGSKAGTGLKIEIFDGGKLYPDYQVPSAVGGGTIEMGLTPLAQFAQFIPVTGVFMQPFLFNFASIVQAASQRGGAIRKIIDGPILRETGARVLWWQPAGWNVIFSKKSAVNPKSIVSENVRVFDDVSSEFVTLCGGVPQVISESKQSEALDLNLVNATVTSAAALRPFELWRRTHFLSDIRHSANILIAVINEDVWNTLSEAERTILSSAAEAVEAQAWREFQQTETETYRLAKANSMVIEEPASDDLLEWRMCSSPILENFMRRAGEPGRQLLANYGKLRADPCCGEAGH